MTRVFFDRSLHQTTSLSYKKLNTNYLVYKTQSDFSLPPIMSWIKTCHTIPQFAGLNFVTVFLFICTTHHLLNSSPEKRNHLETPLCSPMITKQEIIDECTSVKDIRDSSGKIGKYIIISSLLWWHLSGLLSSIKPHSYQIVVVTLHSNFLLPICLVYACTVHTLTWVPNKRAANLILILDFSPPAYTLISY